MTIQPELEAAVVAFVFGDDDVDPGVIVTDGAEIEGFTGWLKALRADLATLKSSLDAPVETSVALARLDALVVEVAAWRDRPAGRDLSADEPSAGAVVISLAEHRKKRARVLRWAGTITAIAAAALLAVQFTGSPDARRPSTAEARAWASELLPGGMAFSGDEPTARDRGVIVGLVRDLSRPAVGHDAPSAEDLQTADVLVAQATRGLELNVSDPVARRAKVAAGCAELLEAAVDIASCEAGVAAYVAHRDKRLAPR